MENKDLTFEIKKYIWIPILMIGLVFVIYLLNFWGNPKSNEPASWGQFGDYFGGILNPLLNTVTIFALLYTINLQLKQLKTSAQQNDLMNMQLDLSKRELELSREELKKSVIAQNKSQLALNKQAEIANKSSELETINFLHLQYTNQLSPHRYDMNSPEATEISSKLSQLNMIIEESYFELIRARNK
ncbi:MAG TPA: hypothetical protein VK958_06610 [Methylophilus sp.]|uniref:hypothetical protein n=1 Tax=Methylophilus sp. TaxID=29541 RepID=UPI002CB9C07A|nr:hypothetical protein [Methylophilus sp.]HSH86907.1 hypothetical protein [Methylophilus sp.]